MSSFVNHTFTTHLAMSASLQPYAGLEAHEMCEYPVKPKRLAAALTDKKLLPDENGCVNVPYLVPRKDDGSVNEIELRSTG